MTQVYVIVALIVVISLLICYLFIRQTITKRKKEKKRLQRALEKRTKYLTQMLSAFPPNFLPKDLQVFLLRCIVDAYEQLSKLDANEPSHLEAYKSFTAQMDVAMRTQHQATEINMDNISQINEMRQFVNYLTEFIKKWAERGNLSKKQYSHYKNMLSQLTTQLMIDNYSLSARQAAQINKPKLAVHYFSLAKDLLLKEGLIKVKKTHFALIEGELKRLTAQLEQDNQNEIHTSIEDSEDTDKEWKQFEENSDWKKKNIYD